MEAIKLGPGRTIGTKSASDIDGSISIQPARESRVPRFKRRMSFVVPGFILEKVSVTQAPSAPNRHGHTGIVCALQLGCSV